MKSSRRFVRYTVIWLAVVAVLPGLLYLMCIPILKNTNEFATVEQYVEATREGPILYNALGVPIRNYKYGVYLDRRPDVAILGTSRGMQVRDYFFNRPAYNLSGLTHGPNELTYVNQSLFAQHRPSVAILMLDFWIFCDQDNSDAPSGVMVETAPGWSWPVKLMLGGELSLENAKAALLGAKSDRVGQVRKLGLSAVLQDNGFGNDGSFYYFGTSIRRFGHGLEARWVEATDRIRNGSAQFVRGCKYRPDKIPQLLAVGERLAGQGTKLVTILAPMPRNILEVMRKRGGYEYIEQARAALRAANFSPSEYYDMFDADSYSSSPCEFVDGFHGGEVTYARLLAKIAENGESQVSRILDLPRLSRLIEINSERSSIDDNPIGKAYRAAFDLDAAECKSRQSKKSSAANPGRLH